MNQSTAKRIRRAIKTGQVKSTIEIVEKFGVTLMEARRCELVTFSRQFVKGKYVPKDL